MIKEVIIVEGKDDIIAVKRACEADCIATSGLGLNDEIIKKIEKAYIQRGLVIFTDPDHAGDVIRAKLSKLFPRAKQAYLPKDDALSKGDVGIENGSPEAILAALGKARVSRQEMAIIFSHEDLAANGLVGQDGASERRDKLGAKLGIGYGNAKTFLGRLNMFEISRDEFDEALKQTQGHIE